MSLRSVRLAFEFGEVKNNRYIYSRGWVRWLILSNSDIF